MAQTPEGKVKAKVSALLKSVGGVHYDMFVPGGFGKPTLDYVGCYRGRYFAIETKAPGKKPTALQNATIASMRSAGATVFVIDGDLGELARWLEEIGNGKE